nr:MAG TPA: hypothetical protein [Herelleviridae sp.]
MHYIKKFTSALSRYPSWATLVSLQLLLYSSRQIKSIDF